MGRWGDEIDDELKKNEQIKVGLLLSFKSMSLVLDRFIQETRESDDQYPKKELLKIWGSIMGIFTVLFTFTYSVFSIVTILFLFFYGYVFLQLARAWNSFKYSKVQLWGMSIAGVAIGLVVAGILRKLIFGP